jgi:hypothetical protein
MKWESFVRQPLFHNPNSVVAFAEENQDILGQTVFQSAFELDTVQVH